MIHSWQLSFEAKMRLILLGLCSVVLVQAKFPLLQRLVDTKQCQGFTCPGSDFGTCCPVEGWYLLKDDLVYITMTESASGTAALTA